MRSSRPEYYASLFSCYCTVLTSKSQQNTELSFIPPRIDQSVACDADSQTRSRPAATQATNQFPRYYDVGISHEVPHSKFSNARKCEQRSERKFSMT